MNRIIREVFGTTRPKDIWSSILTFDRLVTRPVVHIIYWCGLGLLFIAAMGVLGIAVGNAWSDMTVKGVLLSIPVLVVGWIAVLIGILVWRSCCEFYLAVMSIAEDLRVLRQYQEKLTPGPVQETAPAPVRQPAPPSAPEPRYAAEPAPQPQPQADTPARPGDVLEDPFFSPRFGKRDY